MNSRNKGARGYADADNWGYYDESGCPKGIGRDTDACFIGPGPARQALDTTPADTPTGSGLSIEALHDIFTSAMCGESPIGDAQVRAGARAVADAAADHARKEQ